MSGPPVHKCYVLSISDARASDTIQETMPPYSVARIRAPTHTDAQRKTPYAWLFSLLSPPPSLWNTRLVARLVAS
ncbi:hypothetical protein LMG27952_07116 [Paraburkholderia hiiakae]|uniref:Uncharacterized protein n=1 Tax=Paraburkholderia hiiakae TaxID=1081782 RepID=A0ABM8PA43_9BURK|nr:hypothetical protein LMG27952_07116 [Paraburkholderia hiiakae]